MKIADLWLFGKRHSVWTAPVESEATWSDVFRELIDRGLAGVCYVVSDDHKGLRAALQRHFPQSLWQEVPGALAAQHPGQGAQE